MMDNNLKYLIETYGKIVYTHKTHEKASERLTQKVKFLKKMQIVFICATSVGVFSSMTDSLGMYMSQFTMSIVDFSIVIMSLVATGLSIYDLSSNDNEQVNDHNKTINFLIEIREKYLGVIVDYKDGLISDKEMVEKRNELLALLLEIYEEAPRTTERDYIKASKSLKENQESTFLEGEAEDFLPTTLR